LSLLGKLDYPWTLAIVWFGVIPFENQMMILTANRNIKGEDSLKQVMRQENTADSFPVLTITDIDRLDEFD
jgi:hypothetical protein